MKLSAMAISVILALSFFSFQTTSAQQAGLKVSIERGKSVFEANCLPCHQANGSGVSGLNPPLIQTKWVLGAKKTLIGILLNGMDQEIEIKGKFYNNVMPSQQALNDQEIADVLTYVRNSFGNKASAISPAEVKKERK